MKSWIDKIKKTLLSRRGESLIEAVASMLILVILIATVAGMIQTSLRITARAIGEARDVQEEVNQLMLGNFADVGDNKFEIVFIPSAGATITMTQDVDFTDDEEVGMIVFTPR